MIKGIFSVDDVVIVCDIGVDGIILLNYGGC